jgi:hypothetical protein
VGDGQARQLGQRPRQQRALQRQGRLALLAVAQGVVDGGRHAAGEVLDELDVGVGVAVLLLARERQHADRAPDDLQRHHQRAAEPEPAQRVVVPRVAGDGPDDLVGEAPVVDGALLADGLADAGARSGSGG